MDQNSGIVFLAPASACKVNRSPFSNSVARINLFRDVEMSSTTEFFATLSLVGAGVSSRTCLDRIHLRQFYVCSKVFDVLSVEVIGRNWCAKTLRILRIVCRSLKVCS